jgi:serine/threonine protein kinase
MVMLTNPTAEDPNSEESSLDVEDVVTARASRELGILGRCDSPHIVKPGPLPLTAANIADQSVIYFTEEWIDGRDLRAMIGDDGPLPLPQVVRLGRDIARAVDQVWCLVSIHRDIKPGNIMRRDATGDFVLLDMGIAFDLGDASLTSPGVRLGTPIYTSPEQIQYVNKRQMDFRADLFCLGIVLYEAATGSHPFCEPDMNLNDARARILLSNVVRPSLHRTEIPPQMDAVILRLLAKRPHMRYRSCADLIAALNAIPLDSEGR